MNDREQVVAVTTPSQRSWHYRYDDAGRIAAIDLPIGVSTVFDRDADGRLSRITRGDVVCRQQRSQPKAMESLGKT